MEPDPRAHGKESKAERKCKLTPCPEEDLDSESESYWQESNFKDNRDWSDSDCSQQSAYARDKNSRKYAKTKDMSWESYQDKNDDKEESSARSSTQTEAEKEAEAKALKDAANQVELLNEGKWELSCKIALQAEAASFRRNTLRQKDSPQWRQSDD